MMYFCPRCANLLMIKEAHNGQRFACDWCPYIFPIRKPITYRFYPKPKDTNDIRGAVEGGARTEALCSKCKNTEAFFSQVQTRSADEPMTLFFTCTNAKCGHTWKE